MVLANSNREGEEPGRQIRLVCCSEPGAWGKLRSAELALIPKCHYVTCAQLGVVRQKQIRDTKQSCFDAGNGFSSSAAFVTMMKTAYFRDRENLAGVGGLYSARFRTVFLQS